MVVSSVPTNRSNSQRGIGNRRGGLPVASRQMARQSSMDWTSLVNGRSPPMKRAGSPKALAAIAARSSTVSHPTGRVAHMSFGMRCQVEAGGKNFLSVISSMNAMGRRVVTGSSSARRWAATATLVSQDPTPVPSTPMPAAL
jgi:hypothetical protein